jgi:hypothetical protein
MYIIIKKNILIGIFWLESATGLNEYEEKTSVKNKNI